MPIYEFYCPSCNTLFNFLSRKVDTTSIPTCPKCGKKKLQREVSLFSAVGGASEEGEADLPIDESKMEQAMMKLASEAEGMNENDPRQEAHFMRRFSELTGMEYNDQMQQALQRLDDGEDMESIEADMGRLMEGDEDPFVLPGKATGKRRPPPKRDDTLYDM